MKSSRLLVPIAVLVAGLLAIEPVFAAGKGRGGGRGAKSGSHHGHHHHHHRHRHFFGGVFLGSWFYPPSWYYPGYVYLEPAPVMYYIERADEQDSGAGWLFCPGANAYFPTVVECGSGWVRVPAQP
jgi:hypothetical protein